MPESGDGARLPECFWPVAAGCLLACAPPPRAPAPPIQTEFVDGLILVDVTLSGGHGWWLLDSGYECSVLDSTAARAAGIATAAPEKIRAPGGAINQARATGIPLGVSGEEYRPDSLAVVPLAGERRRREVRRGAAVAGTHVDRSAGHSAMSSPCRL
jgi:hypothetical protein